MKNWFLKYKTSFILSLVGGLLGFLYWKFVGCESGSCAITSVWWRATIYGLIMGWLLGGLLNEQLTKSKTRKDEN